MKQSFEYKKAMENMQPGVITADGFLGTDHRALVDIIEADEELMTKLGLDFEVLAARMKHLLVAGMKGLGEPITVDNKWLVRTDETRGKLPSPFEEGGIFNKLNAEVEVLENGRPSGKRIIYNELCIHLISRYHFFQGKGSPFRLDPELAKEILKL